MSYLKRPPAGTVATSTTEVLDVIESRMREMTHQLRRSLARRLVGLPAVIHPPSAMSKLNLCHAMTSAGT